MAAVDRLLPRYQEVLAAYLLADDELARESMLAEATEVGKLACLDDPSVDDLRELHGRALLDLGELWRPALPGTAEAAGSARLADHGAAGPVAMAFMLPLELAQVQRHELRWRRENGKLIALFEQTEDLIVILDARGGIESVNPAFTRVTGWSTLEAASYTAAMWPSPLPAISTRLIRAEQVRRDGGSFLVEWSISPILDQGGELLSHICVGRDLTRRRQVEEGLRENDKLRAVATLAGGIAHDFNNLLGAILGLAELCQLDAVAGSRQARNLGRIREAGDQAATLVRQMLDFSRRTPKTLERVELGALVSRAQPLLRASLPSDLGLLVSVEHEGPVDADPVQIEQVLLNLARNAAHAMRSCAGSVHIVVDQADPGQPAPPPGAPCRHMRLRVIDTGEGIPADVLPKIFDPFFTTKGVGQGTGLGLSAVHGIVSSHGGVIEVSSQPSRGTSFSVFLPLAAPGGLPSD